MKKRNITYVTLILVSVICILLQAAGCAAKQPAAAEIAETTVTEIELEAAGASTSDLQTTAAPETTNQTEPPAAEETEPPTTAPAVTQPAATQPAATQPVGNQPTADTTPTTPKPTDPQPTDPQPTDPQPTGCQHDWVTTHHDAVEHREYGEQCVCGYTAWGAGCTDVIIAHINSFDNLEAFDYHGGYHTTSRWVTDQAAYDETVCSKCGAVQ